MKKGLGQQQGGRRFHVGNFAASGFGEGFFQRHAHHLKPFPFGQLLAARLQIAGQVEMDDLVAVADTGIERGQVNQRARAPAGFLFQLASGYGFGIFARAIQLAGRHLQKEAARRIAKLPHQHGGAVRKQRHHGRSARMIDPLAYRMAAVRQCHLISIHLEQASVENLLGFQRPFFGHA